MPRVIAVSPTPNENALKFTIEGKAIASGSATFKRDTAAQNPIAAAIFANADVVAVFLLNDFVTVTKSPTASWGSLEKAVCKAIEEA
ncbi:NifU N-terminal domain-containing protein [Candidatus Sumerlaeota bacterium]|nr:NifU N-terminal domain-containing protein [Candidatus Sumerlaeota bacterium]